MNNNPTYRPVRICVADLDTCFKPGKSDPPNPEHVNAHLQDNVIAIAIDDGHEDLSHHNLKRSLRKYPSFTVQNESKLIPPWRKSTVERNIRKLNRQLLMSGKCTPTNYLQINQEDK